MKKGSIVKGSIVIGVLDHIDNHKCWVNMPIDYLVKKMDVRKNVWIHIRYVRTPTKKEIQEYKDILKKHGYSYCRGKIIQEL